ALTLALTAAYGVLFHVLIFRPLRAAPPLAKVVASIGLMLALQAITVLRFGSNVLPDPPPILPESTFTLFDTRMPWDRVILAGLVAAAGLVFWILFRSTRIG